MSSQVLAKFSPSNGGPISSRKRQNSRPIGLPRGKIKLQTTRAGEKLSRDCERQRERPTIPSRLLTRSRRYDCQMSIARFLDRMCLALRASGLWLRYTMLQNLIPSFPWIAPGWRAWGRNPRKGRDQILQRSVAEP